MKIVRFVSEEGAGLYGAFEPGEPDRARVIEGDVLGDLP